MEVLFFRKSQPDPLIVGASDIGHGYYGPENRWSGLGIEPWTHKKIMLQGQGFEPWTYQKDNDARPGIWTLDQQKKIMRTIVHAIANMILHMIVKISVRTECTNEFHM